MLLILINVLKIHKYILYTHRETQWSCNLMTSVLKSHWKMIKGEIVQRNQTS